MGLYVAHTITGLIQYVQWCTITFRNTLHLLIGSGKIVRKYGVTVGKVTLEIHLNVYVLHRETH